MMSMPTPDADQLPAHQTRTPATREIAASRSAGPDVLRAMAILLVMIWHLPRPATPPFLEGIKSYGWTGVDLFFVLSGYLIGKQLLAPLTRGRAPSLREFYLKRSLRILPAFLTVLMLYLMLPGIREGSGLQPTWRFLTFTMNFGLDYRLTGSFTQAWSLCVEEHFYLAFPLIVLLLSRLRWQGWALLLSCGILLGGMLLRALLWNEALSAPLANGDLPEIAPTYLKAIYYPTYCRLDGLLFGVLLAAFRTFKPMQWQRYVEPKRTFVIGIILIGLAFITFHSPTTPGFRGPSLTLLGATVGYPLLSLGCACILAASLEWERLFGAWRMPGAATLAMLSYSIYLTHKLATHGYEVLFGAQLAGIAGLGIYFAVSGAAGALLWITVERPFLRLRDRILSGSRASPDGATSSNQDSRELRGKRPTR